MDSALPNGTTEKITIKKRRSEPSGECTTTSRTVDDWLDPCTSCFGVIKTDKLITEECGHSYHSHCHLRLFTKIKSCPLCFRLKLKDGVRSGFKCPLCNELKRRDDWLEHCKEHHRVIRCKRCKELLLLHNKDDHAKTQCKDPSTIPVGCPALYCTVKVTTAIFDKGVKDPSVLVDDHQCREVFVCDGCRNVFLEQKQYEKHLIEAFICEGCGKCFQEKRKYDKHIANAFVCEECGACFQKEQRYEKHNTNRESRSCPLRKNSSIGTRNKRKRAAVEESEKLNNKVRILTKKGVFKKLNEDPEEMSRKRLMQLMDENKHMFK